MKDQTKTKKQLIEELETLRRQAEKANLQVRHEWEDIFQAIGHPTIILDAQHNILSVNKATVIAAGANSAEELTGRKCYEIFHSAGEPPQGCPLVKMLSSATLEESEMEVEAFGGVFLVSCTPVFDEKGNLQKIIHIATDITERKKAEKALQKSEAHLKLQIDRMPIGCIIWDPEFRVVYWNPAAENIFGFTVSDAIGKHPNNIIVPKDAQPLVDNIWHRLLQGDATAHSENENITKDGRIITCYWTNTPLKETDGSIIGVLSMVQDITDRKQAEDEIRKLNTELEQRVIKRTAQIESANRELRNEVIERKQKEEKIKRQNVLLEGINWIVREALTVETEEELASQSLAIAEELTGSKFGFIDELNEAGTMDSMTLSDPGWEVCRMPHTEATILLTNIPVRGIYADAIRKGVSVIVNDPASHPDRVGLPEGHPALTAFLGVPLKQGEKVIGLIGLANKKSGYDTDDQQAIEMLSIAFVEALNRIRSENLIRNLNKELEESITEVSHANKELEAFSYSVSHDLRAPLRAIDGFAEILLREYSLTLDDEGKRICSIITGNTKKMGQLIDELLALSRLSRAEMHFAPIDMKELANRVYLELAPPEMRQRINFHVDDLKKTSGDPILIKQVWMNLISNAVKFTSHREQPIISVTCREEEDRLIYCVKDDGAGFNMHYADKLFGVFQRLHSEKEFEGTGVGLAIVQRIINRHGGKVWAEGEVDKGATFCFSIPIKEGNSE